MWGSLLAVGKWLVTTFVKTLLWTAAHPVAAALVGTGVALSGAWLSQQPWAGAEVLGRALGVIGLTLVQGGLAAWVMGKLVTPVVQVARFTGAFYGTYQALTAPFLTPWW